MVLVLSCHTVLWKESSGPLLTHPGLCQKQRIEKEALTLVWGVKKFQTYLEGRHFTLVTDHEPLKCIMDPGKAVPVTAAARIQRWCLLLGAFSYQIEFRGTK